MMRKSSAMQSEVLETGVASVSRLRQLGLSKNDIRRGVSRGSLTRIRKGWFQSASADRQVQAAVRSGGVLTCVDGAWLLCGQRSRAAKSEFASTPTGTQPTLTPRNEVHFRVPRNSRVKGVSPGQCLLPRKLNEYLEPTVGNGVDTPWNCALSLISSHNLQDPKTSLEIEAALEALLFKGLISTGQLHRLCEIASEKQTRLLHRLTGQCESYLETALRVLLRKARIPFRQQVWIPGTRIRSDFELERGVLIETDGREFHGFDGAFARDRQRDAQLTALGYHVLRFTWHQVINDPDGTLRAIRAALRHRKRVDR